MIEREYPEGKESRPRKCDAYKKNNLKGRKRKEKSKATVQK